MGNKLTVTVGIPAYNEEINIKKLLTSIIRQEQKNYALQEIIVVNDKSTDNTEREILSVPDPLIKLIVNQERLGQPMSQNKILNLAQGDIIVFFKADTVPCNSSAIDELIEPFTKNYARLAMTVGKSVPVLPANFFEKVLYHIHQVKVVMFESWKKGKNIYVANGHSMRAISRKFAIKLFWPKDVPVDDYAYLKMKEYKLRMIKRKNAAVFMRNVTNFQDYLKEKTKIKNKKKVLKQYFPKELLDRELPIPRKYLFRSCARSLFENPALSLFYFFMDLAARILTLKNRSFTSFYEPYFSSKNLSRI